MGTTVTEFIKKNIPQCIKRTKGISAPYTVPCVGEGFIHFYYWDTYFTNIAMLAYKPEQAKNNLAAFRHFVRKYGFIPNAEHITDRSQPPLYTRAVYDYYRTTGDVAELKRNYAYMLREHSFWMEKRTTSVGLNRYYNEGDGNFCKGFFYGVADNRIALDVSGCTDPEREGRNLLAIAESGWDFNPRYKTEYSDFACIDFAPVDLNCILYDAEQKLAEFSAVLGKTGNARKFAQAARRRAALIREYMKGKDGIYRDYNFVTGECSRILSVASLMPFAVGLEKDKVALLAVLDRLQAEWGVLTCEARKDCENFYQWDYPNMWPPMIYFVLQALLENGLFAQARKVASDYVALVDKCFSETGNLWEKYDVVNGSVAVCPEYETPPMVGWTAGVYVLCKQLLSEEAQPTS